MDENKVDEKILDKLNVPRKYQKLLMSTIDSDFEIGLELCSKFENYSTIKLYCVNSAWELNPELENWWIEEGISSYNKDEILKNL